MAWTGAFLALAIAIVLFSRPSIDVELRRDEAIYAYGGQQLAQGVPPYVSILDPKTPLATMIAGAAVAGARTVGVDDLHAIRAVFFVFACLTVVGVYLSAFLLFGSPLGGLLGAATFASFTGFAIDALGGPNAKTPGIAFAVLATALLIGRRWFWGAFAAALAALVWQPLAVYAIVAVGAAWLGANPADRLRHTLAAVAGAAIPFAATVIYFLAAGAFGELFEGAVLLPLTGTQRIEASLLDRLQHIARTVYHGYGYSSLLFWTGLLLLVILVALRVRQRHRDLAALRRDPLISVVLPPLLFLTAFSLIDFQGYPDLYPFLPYAALGISGASVAGLVRLQARRPGYAGRMLAGAMTLALVIATGVSYSQAGPEARALIRQRTAAQEAESMLGAQDTIYGLGNAAPLVLMQRTNPSRFIYLAAGVDQWVIQHTPGGFEGWQQEIAAHDPDMIVSNGWTGDIAARMRAWLRTGYHEIRIGHSTVFVTPALRDRALSSGVGKLVRYGS